MFLPDLAKTYDNVRSRKELFRIGDLNGRTGYKLNDVVVGRYSENVKNDHVEEIVELCEQKSFRRTNGSFKHKNIHKYR